MLVNETDTIIWQKNENPGFRFLSTPQKVLTKISHPKKVTTILRSQISNPKKGFAHPRHLYAWVPPPPWDPASYAGMPRFPLNFSMNTEVKVTENT